MYYITSQEKTQYENGVGFGNRDPESSDIWFMLDLAIADLSKTRFKFATREDLFNQLLIPAANKTKSTNPLALAEKAYYQMVEKEKIIKV